MAEDGFYDQPVDTSRYPDATSNPIKQVADEPVSTFSIDVDTASYANVRRFLNEGTLPPRDAVRVEELINYFDYGYALPTSPDTPFAIHAALAPSPWAPGKEIIHIGLQGYDIAPDKQPPLNLVFLMDVSGSMDEPNKLPLVQKALNVLIDQLRPEDRVSHRRLCRRGRRGARADRRQPEAQDPLRGRRDARGRLDGRRRGPGARLCHGRAGLRRERGQPRHPDDRRRLQRRHRRPGEARGFRRPRSARPASISRSTASAATTTTT